MKKFKMFLISLSLATCFGSTFATQKNTMEKTDTKKFKENKMEERIKEKEEIRKKQIEKIRKKQIEKIRKRKEEKREKEEKIRKKQIEEMKKIINQKQEEKIKRNTIDLTEFNEFLREIKEKKEFATKETITTTKPTLSKKSENILNNLYKLLIKQAKKNGLIKEFSNEEKEMLEDLQKQLLAYIYNVDTYNADDLKDGKSSSYVLPLAIKNHNNKYVPAFNLYLEHNEKNNIELADNEKPFDISMLKLEEEDEEEYENKDINTFIIPKNKIDTIEKLNVFEENVDQFFEDMKPNYSYNTENLFTEKQNENFNLFFKSLTDNDLEIKLIKDEIVNILKNEDFSNEEKVIPLYMLDSESKENLFECDGKYIMLGITKENENFKVRIFTIYKK